MNSKPLQGRRIVITRARRQAHAFAAAVEALGGEVLEFPTIEILPPESFDEMDRAIRAIESYDWMIFTSANGVRHFLLRFQALGRCVEDLARVRIAAVGPETAALARSFNLRVDLVPKEYRAEGLLEELRVYNLAGARVLLPRAREARDVLPKTLEDWGAEVHAVEAYRTVPAKNDAAALRDSLVRGEIDMITFSSPSTVTNFAASFPAGDMARLLSRTAVACIGPVTEQRAREKGLRVDVVAKEYTIEGLTRAIVDYFTGRNRRQKTR